MSESTDELVDRRRLARQISFWRTLAIVLAVAVVGVAVGRFGGLRDGAHVARLTVSNVIVEDTDRLEALDGVLEDDDAKALIVRIDSPGGTTVGGESLYYALRRVAEKKPVVAVIGTLGASAGYMVAAAADRIVARETSVTGSIGVILQTAEITGLLEKLGISAEAIKSAPLKASPSPLEKLTEEARAASQAVVDDTHRWFSDLVAERRALSSVQAARIADGRVFTGRQAVEEGLVDALGGEREARDWLESEHAVSRELPVLELEFGPDEDWLERLLSGVAGKTFLSERLILDGLISVWHPDG